MIIKELTVGPVATCCYVLSQENAKECIVIDPGDEPERILKATEGKRIAAILLTHGHFDHIEAVSALMGDGTRLFIHELDAPMLTDPGLNVSRLLMYRDVTSSEATDFVKEGDVLSLAGLTVEVLHTPGHTPGSVCFRIDNELFTGDTLFEHGWGRTDFPGGDEHTLFASLRRIMPLTKTMAIHPGHNS